MKIINNFLFIEQKFIDTEITKPACINIDAIDNIMVSHNDIGECVIIETLEGKFLVAYDPEDFFIDFANLLQKTEDKNGNY
jgi:hypothetical protein